MPAPLLTREELLDRLTAVFREYGYQGASIAVLSKGTGLGKASLYHAFKGGKQEMAEQALDHVAARFESSVLAPLDEAGGARERLTRMLMALDEFYSSGQNSCLFELFSVGSAARLFHERLARAFEGFASRLARVLVDWGLPERLAARSAMEAVVAVQGALVVSRGTADPELFRRLLAGLPDHLLAAD